MYEAKVYRVMIGAPSDIKEEIKEIKGYIHSWNPLHSEDKGVVIFPINWETDCHPASNVHPQEHINHTVTDKSDMLVCVFGAKLGTPTEKEKSGTVEELKKHIAAGKPAMVYFKTSVRNLNDIQPEQLQKIRDFKEEIKDRVLFREYGSVKEFKKRFGSDFELAVNDYFTGVSSHPRQTVSPKAKKAKYVPAPSGAQGKKPNTRLSVKFPDGIVLEERYAYRTFAEAITRIGARRVMSLGIRSCGVPLVGREISDRYADSQVNVGNGMYVLTHSSTQGKKRFLDRISRELGLGLEVGII